jgi:cyclopropane-fatty-acyl-phospholipid synthase
MTSTAFTRLAPGPARTPVPPGRPAVPPVPAGAGAWARARAARALLRQVTGRLPVRVQAPDGRVSGAGGPTAPALRILREDAFYRRIGSGAAGLAESYMAGDWTSTDLVGLFTMFAEHVATIVPQPLQALRRWYIPGEPAAEEATVEGARRNIERHYDLSDDLFALFLGPTMTYSSALFAPGDTLADAQHRKIDTLLDRTGTGPGSTVLEIGTGWGELAVRAASRGARVTTLTISPAQYAAARRRAAGAGVADRVDVRLRDYREATGRYDVVLSVEMIEAVGERYWPAYFTTIDRLLAPGGRAGLQAITMPHDRMLATRNTYTWINKYIFPGGLIPSVQAIEENLSEHTTLRVTQRRDLGNDYATTVRSWRERFLANWSTVARAGFDDTFRRGWEYYLAYCEAGFRAGYLDVSQFRLTRAEG